MSEYLARAKDEADRHCADGPTTAGSPDERTIPYLLAGILEALIAIAERPADVEPGPCWRDSGIDWPGGIRPRCELRAGHAGAHECDRGSMGGTATWIETTPTTHGPDAGEREDETR